MPWRIQSERLSRDGWMVDGGPCILAIDQERFGRGRLDFRIVGMPIGGEPEQRRRLGGEKQRRRRWLNERRPAHQ